MKNMLIPIKGQEWTVRIVTRRWYNSNMPIQFKGTYGLTDPTSKEIFFIKNEFSTENCIHELVHAFVAETHTESTDMSLRDMEELIAAIVGANYYEIGNLCNRITTGILQSRVK